MGIEDKPYVSLQELLDWIVEEGAKMGWSCDQTEIASFFSEVASKNKIVFDFEHYRKKMEYYAELELKEEQNEN